MITEAEFVSAAAEIGCEEAAVKAVTAVESDGEGFLPSGKIILKFEGHIFHHYTGGRFDAAHPTLSYPKWTEAYSQFGEHAYLRFDQAFALDPHAAMLSSSWGAFQIMGSNFTDCGFKTVDEFVTFLKIDESHHLEAFIKYVLNDHLAQFLISRNWAAFALHYNGKLYQRNHYDTKLANQYAKFKTP